MIYMFNINVLKLKQYEFFTKILSLIVALNKNEITYTNFHQILSIK